MVQRCLAPARRCVVTALLVVGSLVALLAAVYVVGEVVLLLVRGGDS